MDKSMNKFCALISIMLCLAVGTSFAQDRYAPPATDWAAVRSALVTKVSYDLTFYIPSAPSEKLSGMAVVTFTLPYKTDMALDFDGQLTGTCIINDKKRRLTAAGGHILIPRKHTRPGANRVVISFQTQGAALVRTADCVYTCFDRKAASTCFPCFDQPDLRATFLTHLNLPEGWTSVASNCHGPVTTGQYAFIAGQFDEQSIEHHGHSMHALYRPQDVGDRQQVNRLLEECAQAVSWMEDYTGLPYPFDECSVLMLPESRFSPIDYAGAVSLTDRSLFDNAQPTAEERQWQSELIAHETAHLWFGTIVSPPSPADAWVKELLAGYAAMKMGQDKHPRQGADLDFLATRQARAIAVDSTAATHPIASTPEDGNHSHYVNDPVWRDKGAVVMRLLEDRIGATTLQSCLQTYLRKHYFKSASWDDLLDIADELSPEASVRPLSEAWLQQEGLPAVHLSATDSHTITVSQQGRFWPMRFDVRLIYDFDSSRTVTVDMTEPRTTISVDSLPSTIIPNYDGRGYGLFTMDPHYTGKMPLRIIVTHDDLNRYALLQTTYDNYLRGHVAPSYFGELYRDMCRERNPIIMRTALDHMMRIATDRETWQERHTLEQCITDLLGENRRGDCRRAVVGKMAACATATEVLDLLYDLWQRHDDRTLSEADYTAIAYRLAIKRPQQWHDILARQRQLLGSEQARQELDYVGRACNPDAPARQALAAELRRADDDTPEKWRRQAMRLLDEWK